MSKTRLEPVRLIAAAEGFASVLVRAKAREAEIARRPLDEVIDAMRNKWGVGRTGRRRTVWAVALSRI